MRAKNNKIIIIYTYNIIMYLCIHTVHILTPRRRRRQVCCCIVRGLHFFFFIARFLSFCEWHFNTLSVRLQVCEFIILLYKCVYSDRDGKTIRCCCQCSILLCMCACACVTCAKMYVNDKCVVKISH